MWVLAPRLMACQTLTGCPLAAVWETLGEGAAMQLGGVVVVGVGRVGAVAVAVAALARVAGRPWTQAHWRRCYAPAGPVRRLAHHVGEKARSGRPTPRARIRV